VREAEILMETAVRILGYVELRVGKKEGALYNSPCLFIDDGIPGREPIVEIPSERVWRGVYGSLNTSCELRTYKSLYPDLCHVVI